MSGHVLAVGRVGCSSVFAVCYCSHCCQSCMGRKEALISCVHYFEQGPGPAVGFPSAMPLIFTRRRYSSWPLSVISIKKNWGRRLYVHQLPLVGSVFIIEYISCRGMPTTYSSRSQASIPIPRTSFTACAPENLKVA